MCAQRWEQLAEPKEAITIVRQAKEQLQTAWNWDQKDPNSFPMNTAHLIADVKERLLGKKRHKRASIYVPKPRTPRSLWELIPEKDVKAIWEMQHEGTFRDAVKRASGIQDDEDEEKSRKTFRGIVRAIEHAYALNIVSPQLLPKPKISLLHRGLSKIANAAGLKGQIEEGFAEFLDDICPCGIRNHRESVRKMSRRSPRMRRPKRS